MIRLVNVESLFTFMWIWSFKEKTRVQVKVTYFFCHWPMPPGVMVWSDPGSRGWRFLTEEKRRKVQCTTCSGFRKQGFKPSAYNHIIGSGARKVNWTNLIFMCKPLAEVLRLPVSLQQIPVCIHGLVFFIGNRILMPYNVSLNTGFHVKTNTDC